MRGAARVDRTKCGWDHNGGVSGAESFPVDPAGFEEPVGWLAAFGPADKIGVKGTRS